MVSSPPTIDIARELAQTTLTTPISSLTPLGEGDHFTTFLINNAWVLRIAKGAVGADTLPIECQWLEHLAQHHPNLAIPRVSHASFDHATSHAWILYPCIVGEKIPKKGFDGRLGDQGVEHAGQMFAQMLECMHHIDPAEAHALGIRDAPYPFARVREGFRDGDAATLYREDLTALGQHAALDPTVLHVCTHACDQLIERAERVQRRPAHGDLTRENILFDVTRIPPQPSAFIDFSDTVVTDPCIDLAYLFDAFGDTLSRATIAHYPRDVYQLERGVKLLRFWICTLRMEWCLTHTYQPGIDWWTEHLPRLFDTL